MTTPVAFRPASSVGSQLASTPRPTFLGVLRGELFKLTQQRLNWWMLLGITVITLVPYLYGVAYNAASSANHIQTLEALRNPPQLFLYYVMGFTLALQRVFVGIFLLIATARMVGLDFHNGTIRVLLARGVGRLQLLGAKLAAMTLVGLGLLAWGIVLNAIGTVVLVQAVAGTLAAFTALTHPFWVATGVDILTVLVSMGVSILLAAAVTIVTRSLSFGLAGALGWFAADNIAVQLLSLIHILTNNDIWLKVTSYLLGPELNVMPAVVAPAVTITGTVQGHVLSKLTAVPVLGVTPLVNYDGTHALMVALVYGVVFAAVAIVLMWRRDVLE
jgi:ABC-2 type transport system permease protein